jgi:hypothetical protein
MGPRLFQDEPGGERDESAQGMGFRIDPADRPFAASEPERPPESWAPGAGGGLRFGLTRVAVAVVFMMVAAGGLWFAYSKGRSAASGGEVPLIRADQTAMKVKPDGPGGVSEDGDAPVYDVGATSGAKVEELLPGPEQPLPKPLPVVPPTAVAASPPTAATAAAPAPSVSIPPTAAPSTQTIAASPAPAGAPAAAVQPTSSKPSPAEGDAATPPPPAAATSAAATSSPTLPTQVAVAATGALRIQIAATKDIASAHREWTRLKAAHKDVLGDLKAFGVRVDLGARGVFYRIQAGPIPTRADALHRCAVLKQSGIGCLIVRQP